MRRCLRCSLACLLCGCALMPYYEEAPCNLRESETRPCGACRAGEQLWACDASGRFAPVTVCEGNPFDEDGDGYANQGCIGTCCGEVRDCDDSCEECRPGGQEVPGNDWDEDCSGTALDVDGDGFAAFADGGEDCDDTDPNRWQGHADLDGDGFVAQTCGGDDCDDTDHLRWTGHADLDGDGHIAAVCGGIDCDDDHPGRWTGHADLDGDGHDAEVCGGIDCDDDHPGRWLGHGDADGDGYDAAVCGGDDCNDSDGRRWNGHADLDGDGLDDALCGGTDCDDDCRSCFVGSDASCDGARDHNCDGIVDELLGCHVVRPSQICEIDRITEVGSVRGVFVSEVHLGALVYVASDNGLFELDVDPMGLVGVGTRLDVGSSWDVFVAGQQVYVVTSEGLSIVHADGLHRLALLASIESVGDSRGLFASRHHVYVASFFGLAIVNVRQPQSPFVAGVVSEGLVRDSRAVFVHDGVAYVAAHSSTLDVSRTGLYRVDVSTPGLPSQQGVPTTDGSANDVFVRDGMAYVASAAGLDAYTLGEGPALERRWHVSLEDDETTTSARGLYVSAENAYVATAQGLHIVDLEHPESETQVVDTGPAYDVFVWGNLAFVGARFGLVVLGLHCAEE